MNNFSNLCTNADMANKENKGEINMTRTKEYNRRHNFQKETDYDDSDHVR